MRTSGDEFAFGYFFVVKRKVHGVASLTVKKPITDKDTTPLNNVEKAVSGILEEAFDISLASDEVKLAAERIREILTSSV